MDKAAELLFRKYQPLALKYAYKVNNYEELSYEFQDLTQELSIKIYTSILAYRKRMESFKQGRSAKPVPLKYYIEAALSNKVRDLMKFISRENYKVRIDDINYDFGIEDTETEIIPEENIFLLNGVNLLEGLTGKERVIFSLFLRGYNAKFLNKVYYSTRTEKVCKKMIIENDDEPLTVMEIIEEHKKYLEKKYGNVLHETKRKYTCFHIEEE